MHGKKELLEKMTTGNVNITYTGPFDAQVLSVLAKSIEYSLSENPRVNKKMFKIFLELAQNISYYSAEQSISKHGIKSGIGILVIQELNDHFIFATGNLIESSSAYKINKKCEKINSLSREQLRAYKRSQRKLPPGKKGGGNIGLIQVALTAENTLNYKLVPVDEMSYFFIVSTKIDKE